MYYIVLYILYCIGLYYCTVLKDTLLYSTVPQETAGNTDTACSDCTVQYVLFVGV